jgi:RNA polymerase sigma-70 factor (ECF subfamily)
MTATSTQQERSTPTDEQLLLAYRIRGDGDAFSELVRRYERELYCYLRQYLGDPAMAEDVFQTTFLQLHLKCDQFKPGLKLRPWLYRIATNQAIDTVRRNRRHRLPSLDGSADTEAAVGATLVSDTPTPDQHMEQQDKRTWAQQAVDQLPEQLAQIVTLVYLNGLKYREAAEVLAIPLGTLKSRMHTALRMLGDACPAHLAPTG